MNTDPIADFLTRIRNASLVSHPHLELPASKLKVELAKLLQKEGYIQSYQIKDGSKYKLLRLVLKYDQEGYPVIRKIQRVSKPGLRKYSKSDTIPRVLSGAGVAVLSTSKGLMTDRQARKENIGGEILCTVY